MTYNTADPKAIKRAEKAAKQDALERRQVIVELASTQAGRKYLWDKLAAAHIFQTSYHENPIQMAFSEGERNQGLHLLNDIIESCPEQFIQAMREANERRDTGQQLSATERSSSEGNGRDDQGPTGDAASGDTGSEDAGYEIGTSGEA